MPLGLKTTLNSPNCQDIRRSGLHFCGQGATALAGQRRLHPEELQDALEKDVSKGDTPYVGNVQQVLGLNGEQEQQFFGCLNRLAHYLKLMKYPKEEGTTPAGFDPGTAIKYKYVDEGDFGVVYQVHLKDKTFAFKIFKDPQVFPGQYCTSIPTFLSFVEKDTNGPYAEAATGYFLTQSKQTQNLATFYAANPKAGWQLSEFIDRHTDYPARKGESLSQQGYAIVDTEGNSPIRAQGGMVWFDYGWILDKQQYQRLLKAEEKYRNHVTSADPELIPASGLWKDAWWA